MDSPVVLRRGDFVALRDAVLTIKGGRFYEKLRSGTRAKAFVYRTWLCHYVLGFRLPWHHWTMTTNPRRPSGRLFCVHFDLCSAYPRASTCHAADWAHSRSNKHGLREKCRSGPRPFACFFVCVLTYSPYAPILALPPHRTPVPR